MIATQAVYLWLLLQTPEIIQQGVPMWERVLVPIVTAAASGFLTYLVTRPKTQADINKTGADARKVEEEIMRDTREDLKTWVARFAALADEQRTIEDEFDDMKRQFRNMREDVSVFLEKVEGALIEVDQFPNILREIQKLRTRYQIEPGGDTRPVSGE